jgi:hypothetical protein
METTTPSKQSIAELPTSERITEERGLLSLGLVSLDTATLSDLYESVSLMRKAGLFPNKVASTEQAIAILLQGKELGFGYYESLKFIDVINGMPTVSGAGKGALLKRRNIRFRIVDDATPIKINPIKIGSTDVEVDYITTIEFYDPTAPEGFKIVRFSFSYVEAALQGLTEKAMWKKMWKIMLRWRALSGGANFYFPEYMHRMYMPDEIDPTYESVEEWS